MTSAKREILPDLLEVEKSLRRQFSHLKSGDDATDFAFQAYLNSATMLPGVSDPDRYLHRVARNLVLDDMRRRHVRSRAYQAVVEAQSLGLHSVELGPELQLIRNEQISEIRSAFNAAYRASNSVGRLQLAALWLRHAEELTFEEIAGQLGTNAATARTWRSRGQRVFQAYLAGRSREHACTDDRNSSS